METTTATMYIGTVERSPAGKERKRKINTYEVNRKCGKRSCGGTLISTGTMFTTMPPSFRNRCDKCGALYDLDKAYPFIEQI